MTKKEIIEIYIADLNNLVSNSEAKRSRLNDLEDELEALKQSENVVLDSVSKQRELLLAYHNHLDNFNDPTIYNASESMIDDYLANNCC